MNETVRRKIIEELIQFNVENFVLLDSSFDVFLNKVFKKGVKGFESYTDIELITSYLELLKALKKRV